MPQYLIKNKFTGRILSTCEGETKEKAMRNFLFKWTGFGSSEFQICLPVEIENFQNDLDITEIDVG